MVVRLLAGHLVVHRVVHMLEGHSAVHMVVHLVSFMVVQMVVHLTRTQLQIFFEYDRKQSTPEHSPEKGKKESN